MAALKDKVPPHNPDAEKAVLGALLLDKDAIAVALQYLRADDFYSTACAVVFESIVRLYNDGGRKADILTVTDELRSSGNLERAGGEAFVAALPNLVPTSANVDYYAQTVRDCSLRRTIIKAAATMGALAYDESQRSRDILEEAQRLIFELTDRGQIFSYRSVYETVKEAIEIIERVYRNRTEYTGIASGFGELDSLTSGFQKSELIIIGARPSIGKTALALNMASYIAMHDKKPVAFFTLEMSDVSLVMRLISSEAQIDSNSLRTGFLKASDFPRLVESASNIAEAPFFTVDMPNMKLLDLRSLARRLRAKEHVEIIFIDYLQLISIENPDVQEYEKVSQISRSLKALARELDIPVVALSQLGRPAEGNKPLLSNIRGSGSIEQDADVVMFLHRDRESEKLAEGGEKSEAISTELMLAKQRNGPVGTVNLLFKPKFAQFYNSAERS
jgi:replicative DNA helicase